MLALYINFLAIFTLLFFIGSNKNTKNILTAFFIATFIILEVISYMYFSTMIDEKFIFFLFNIQVFLITIHTKLVVTYLIISFFCVCFSLVYLILQRFQIKKFRKQIATLCLALLFLPIGFLYSILHVLIIDYGKSYFKNREYSYQDLYKKAKNENYITNNEIKILNPNSKHKNLILIYLESLDQSYLTNINIKPYTKDLVKMAKSGEFYDNIKQISGIMGTTAGIISSQCGSKYLSYFIFDNPYGKINKHQKLTCLPDVLNKARYTQIFLGGADKKLFNKGNYLLSHKYDIVEDEHSLIKKNPNLKPLNWGVSDYDLFKIAKTKYLQLSKKNEPFNITLLTTSTHNPSGIRDERCKNSSKNNLINGVECTNDLLDDFVSFLKKQPNYKDTLIVILPDHIQYYYCSLSGVIKEEEKKLYVILLNSDKIENMNTEITYLDLPEIIINRLNIKSNANFLGNQGDDLSKNFMYRLHKNKR